MIASYVLHFGNDDGQKSRANTIYHVFVYRCLSLVEQSLFHFRQRKNRRRQTHFISIFTDSRCLFSLAFVSRLAQLLFLIITIHLVLCSTKSSKMNLNNIYFTNANYFRWLDHIWLKRFHIHLKFDRNLQRVFGGRNLIETN